jgi:hypothetical protein
MKKLINSIRAKVNSLATRTVTAVTNTQAEGYVDSGVKILIAVVIGALLLGGLYTLFNDTIMPTVTERITEMFAYAG